MPGFMNPAVESGQAQIRLSNTPFPLPGRVPHSPQLYYFIDSGKIPWVSSCIPVYFIFGFALRGYEMSFFGSEQKKSKAKQYYIKDGIMSFGDDFLVTDNISSVFAVERKSYWLALIILVPGLLATWDSVRSSRHFLLNLPLFISRTPLFIPAFLAMLLGMYLLYRVVMFNWRQADRLHVMLNSGMRVIFDAGTQEFMVRVINTLKAAIRDRKKSYYIDARTNVIKIEGDNFGDIAVNSVTKGAPRIQNRQKAGDHVSGSMNVAVDGTQVNAGRDVGSVSVNASRQITGIDFQLLSRDIESAAEKLPADSPGRSVLREALEKLAQGDERGLLEKLGANHSRLTDPIVAGVASKYLRAYPNRPHVQLISDTQHS